MDRRTNEYEKRKVNTQTGKKKLTKRARKRRKRKIAIFTTEIVAFLIVIMALYVVTQWDRIQKPSFTKNQIKTNELDQSVIDSMKGYSTYALFGVDARNQQQLDKGNRSDTIMIASVNHDTGEIKIVSIYRDTYLCVDDDGDLGKINGAYNTGGALNAINMLNKNLDLDIDGYVTVNWYALAKTIDLLGGIEVTVTDDILHHPTKGNLLNGYIIETSESTGIPTAGINEPGTYNLTGVQAVAYSRIRYVKGGDYTRAEHQREVVGLMFDKVKTMNFSQLTAIMNEVLPNVQTNVDMAEALSLAKYVTKYNITMGEGFPFDKDTKDMGSKKGDVVVPLNLEQNVAKLHEALYDSGETYVTSSEVSSLSRQIEKSTGLSAQ